MDKLEYLSFTVHCKCGGHLYFSVESVNEDKRYLCPECSTDLTGEIQTFLINMKDAIKQNVKHCKNNTINTKSVRIEGYLLR